MSMLRSATRRLLPATLGVVLAGAALSSAVAFAQPAASATASVRNAAGAPVGTATFTPTGGGVQISARFQGLSPGQHGIHVHTAGQCDAPDFMTAGGHFNPTNRQHGLDNPQGAHVGDLPNLVVGADGSATFNGVLRGATLDGSATSLLKEGGTALVIHADMDDEMTDPAGNSGARMACGVIMAGAQGGAPVQTPRALPNTGDLGGLPGGLAALGLLSLGAGLALRRRGASAPK